MREFTVEGPDYEYYGQRVANVLAMGPATTGASAYYVVGAHYDTVPGTPGADDNASAVAVMLELSRRVQQHRLKAPGALCRVYARGTASPFNKSPRQSDLRSPVSKPRRPCTRRNRLRDGRLFSPPPGITRSSLAGPAALPGGTSLA